MKKFIYNIFCFSLILSNFNFLNIQAIETNEESNEVIEYKMSTTKEIDVSLLTYEIIDGEVTITNCDKTVSGNLIIPSEIEGYPVTTINNDAFSNCDEIISIKIPSSIKTIGNDAFSWCSKLNNISFSYGLQTIGDSAFFGTRLKDVIIPNSVSSIGEGAFQQSDLVSITLSNNIKTIKSNTFYYCDSLENVKIPYGVEIIENNAFSFCNKLKEIVIPDSVLAINDNAFSSSGLEKIQLSSNLKTIGIEAFRNTSLNNVIIPNSVTSLGKGAFKNSKLVSITLSKNIKILEEELFSFCKSLENVDIPYGVEEIKKQVFYYCVSLKEITIPDSVHTIRYNAIYSCDSLEKVYLSNNLRMAENNAIYFNKNLNFLHLPSSLTKFEINSFNNNPQLIIGCYKNSHAADFLKDRIEFYYIDGTTEENTLSGTFQNMSWQINRKTGEMTINCDGVMPVDSNGNVPWQSKLRRYITSLTISEGCTSIANNAFQVCERLSSIQLPSTLEVIGEYSFNRTNLKEIILPDKITVIDNYAFNGNSNLESIKLPSNLLVLGDSSLSNCAIKEIELPNYLLYIGSYALYRNSLTTIDIPGFVEYIDSYAFAYNNLEEIIFPHSVLYIGGDVVSSNDNLKKVVIYQKDCQFGYRLSINNIDVYGFKGSTAETIANSERHNFIELKNVDIASLKLSAVLEYNQIQFDGKEKKPSILINGLIEDIDYTVSYLENINAGIGIIKINGIGNYTGEGYLGFEILPIDASEYNVELSYTNTIYNGMKKTPVITITDQNGYTLLKDKDYQVTYENNVNVGTATAKIIFIGNYSGEIIKTFTINAKQDDKILLGDVNLDGFVNNKDRLELTRYLAKWNGYTIDEFNADVNQDGSVNSLDRIILTRYLAKWEGYKLPYKK